MTVRCDGGQLERILAISRGTWRVVAARRCRRAIVGRAERGRARGSCARARSFERGGISRNGRSADLPGGVWASRVGPGSHARSCLHRDLPRRLEADRSPIGTSPRPVARASRPPPSELLIRLHEPHHQHQHPTRMRTCVFSALFGTAPTTPLHGRECGERPRLRGRGLRGRARTLRQLDGHVLSARVLRRAGDRNRCGRGRPCRRCLAGDRRGDVFAYGMGAASLELMQLLQMVVAPWGRR